MKTTLECESHLCVYFQTDNTNDLRRFGLDVIEPIKGECKFKSVIIRGGKCFNYEV